MRTALALAVVAGCGFSQSIGGVTGDAPPMIDARPIDGAPGAARKRLITIPDAKVFATVVDFPVWLVIDDLAGLGAKATAAGTDIYFTRTDGQVLEYERIAWNKATGHLEAWVRTTLTDGGPSEFELRFGDPGPAHGPNPLQTWTNNFVAVWHMDDISAANAVADARGIVNGTAVNGPVSTAAGKLGKAIDFDGTNDEVTFTNPVAGDGSTTISAWVQVSLPSAGFSSIMTVGNNAMNQSRFLHTNYMGLANGFFGQDFQTSLSIHNNQFTLIHWVYDNAANTTALYRDGVQVGTTQPVNGTINTTGTGGHIGNAPMQWGPGGNTPNPVNGIIDEVHLVTAPRSAGWIRTEYENQRDVGAFFTLGLDVAAP